MFRQSFGLFIEAGADMECFGFEDQHAGLIEDAVSEIQADFFRGGNPDLDSQHIVISCGGFVTETAFHDGENCILFLPMQESRAQMPEELAPSGFEQIEVARIIDVIAYSAFGVGYAMGVLENGHFQKG